jgi:hypothetical protein
MALGDILYTDGSLNLWFQADNPRVAANLLDATSNQYRSTVHPIMPILLTPWASLLPKLGMSPLWWGKALVVACAAISAGALFLALRLLTIPLGPSALFAGLFVSSAGFLHWYSNIETAGFNGVSICLILLLLAYGPTKRRIWWVIASALTLSFTITNWSAGLAAAIARWPVRRAITISAMALCVVVVLSLAQKLLYPTAGLFFDLRQLREERNFHAGKTYPWAPLDNLRSLAIYTVVTPPPVLEEQGGSMVVTNQRQPPTAAGALGLLAMVAWLALLVAGAWGARAKSLRPVAFGLGLMLLGQIALGLVYGDLTFLYATNILPMLVVWAALSWFTPVRYAALGLAAVVIAAGLPNNLAQYFAAARLSREVIDGGGNPKAAWYPAGRVVLPAQALRSVPR